MERKIYWTIGLFSIAVLIGTFFMPADPTKLNDLPWHIEHPTADTIKVFDLTLGSSNANQAEQRFREQAIPSLFKSGDGKLVPEIFFEQVDLAGLRAKIVLNIDVPEAELPGMYERGLRMSATGSGKKITLAPEDVQRLRALPINGLTYMPSIRLEKETLFKRFGKPAQQVREKESGLEHWLYPDSGLDISLPESGKPVFQYIAPRNFKLLAEPLLAQGEIIPL